MATRIGSGVRQVGGVAVDLGRRYQAKRDTLEPILRAVLDVVALAAVIIRTGRASGARSSCTDAHRAPSTASSPGSSEAVAPMAMAR
jgi:hypothetical protein